MSKLHIKLDIQRFAASMSIESSVVTQDPIADNRSIVRITVKIWKSSGSTHWYHPNYRTLTITCDGQTATFSTELYENKTSTYSYDFSIPHNADGTKYIEYSANIPKQGDWARLYETGSATLPTIPREANITYFNVNQRDETSFTFDFGVDATIDYCWYSIDNGANWNSTGVSADSRQFVVSGLTANTPYNNCKIKVRRQDSQLVKESWSVSQTTFDYPKPTSTNNFTIEGNNCRVELYNPLHRQVTMTIHNSNTNAVIGTYNGTYHGVITVEYYTQEAINLQYASIPSSPSGTYYAKVVCSETGTTKTHYTANNNTYSVIDDKCRPTMTSVGYEDIEATTLALTGDDQTLINGYSTIQVTIPSNNKPTPNKSASGIRGYKIQNGTYTSPSEIPESAGNDVVLTCPATSDVIKVMAIDTRGVSNTYTIPNVTLINYTPIQKNANPKAERCDNTGTPNGVGEYVKITLDGEYWNNSFGDVTNSISTKTYSYKNNKSSGEPITGTTILTVTTDNEDYEIEQLILGDKPNGFDIQNTYTIWVKVGDALSTTTFEITLTSGTPLVAYADDGIAIKKMYDTNDDAVLQVAGNESVDGDINFKNNTLNTESGIYWKETGFGDKFKIIPTFQNTGDNNKLKVQGATGGADTDPSLDDLAYITGESGNVWIKGQLVADGGMRTQNVAGYRTDQFGNFLHTDSSTTNNFQIKDYSGNIKYQFFFETGEVYINGSKQYAGYELYAGDTTTNFSLSSNLSNYNFVEVYFRTNDGSKWQGCVKSIVYNGETTVNAWYCWNLSGTHYVKTADIWLSGTGGGFNANSQFVLNTGQIDNGNYIYVTKVIGYK